MNNVNFYKSLGDKKYLSLLKYCDSMIGNSSSGFTEAPYFKTPVVNIGDRQYGRPISNNIYNADINYSSIEKKFQLTLKENKIKNMENKYGKPGASNKIYNILRKINFHQIYLKKKFNDI